jgi:hypothetical protein
MHHAMRGVIIARMHTHRMYSLHSVIRARMHMYRTYSVHGWYIPVLPILSVVIVKHSH